MSLKKILLAGAIGYLVALPASAAVTSVYNNMAQASDPALMPISADWAGGVGGGPLAQSFNTTATTTSLQDISVLLSEQSNIDPTTGLPYDGASFVITLMQDDGSGNPDLFSDPLWSSGSILDSAYTPDANGYWSMTFTDGEGISLAPSTAYWIGVQTFYDPLSQPAPIPTGADWLLANVQDGAPTGLSQYYYGGSYVSDGNPFVMAVSVNDAGNTDTPEPATLAVLGVGLAGIGVVRRRLIKRGS